MSEENKETITRYPITDEMQIRLANVFTYHRPTESQPPRYKQLRDDALNLAMRICYLTPPSREQSLALTKLEEAIMFANAAIARNEPSADDGP